ncbi:hypothetical protein LZ32DRAFT_658793 [Colletotrichum eremochloae]|nr:hypothetical protein LZ32DRAFT_658793 [Colletotrichum eremochloae]
MELKSSAGTKGRIQESFRGWWRIPWALSLGMWHGKRDSDLHKGKDPFKLEIHFTVALLQKSGCRLYKGYKYSAQSSRWLKKTMENVYFDVAIPSEDECALLEKWENIVTRFDQSARKEEHLRDYDEDVDWTKVAGKLGWEKPDGKIYEDALVYLIVRDIGRQKDRISASKRSSSGQQQQQQQQEGPSTGEEPGIENTEESPNCPSSSSSSSNSTISSTSSNSSNTSRGVEVGGEGGEGGGGAEDEEGGVVGTSLKMTPVV